METKSFKQMIQAGEVKRADAMKVPLDDIHEEPGFNLRTEGEELEASISALALHIFGGGMVPALEVRPRPGGGVFVVDGHRRRRAYIKAREMGAPIEYVPIVAFTGNDADRVARIITSAEGRALTPLEVARGYKRLVAFGKTEADIAAMVGKTVQHVTQLLTLANANTDVQQMVAAGGVAAATAVKVVRQHGENAGQVLQQEMGKAKAAGKAKVTAGTMKQWTPPAKVVEPLVLSVDGLIESLGWAEHETLKGVRDGLPDTTMQVSARIVLSLLDHHQALTDARKKAEAKAREKAAKASQGQLQEGVGR